MPTADSRVPVTLEKCDEQIPALSITRQFDFGQFIALYYEEADPKSPDYGKPPRKVVITGQGGLATMSQTMKLSAMAAASIEGQPVPEFIEVSPTTKDLFNVLDYEATPNRGATSVTIRDVSAFLSSGSVTHGGVRFQVEIDDELERTLSAGYSTVVEASSDPDQELSRLVLIPHVKTVTLKSADVSRLLAGELLTLDMHSRRGDLTPEVIRALLDGQKAIIRATGGGAKPAPVLVEVEGVEVRPAVSDLSIPDLAAFLGRPQIPGSGGAPIDVTLTAAAIDALRNQKAADVEVGSTRVRLNVMEVAPLVRSEVLTIREDLSSRIRGNPVPQPVLPADLSIVGWQPVEVISRRLPPGVSLPPKKQPDAKSPGDLVLPRLVPGTGLHVALFVPWRQTWKLKGFSRGNLLQSLAMAPQEEVTLELSSWEHRTGPVVIEDSSESDVKQTLQSSETLMDTQDVFNELIATRGFSWQVEGGIDAALNSNSLTVSTGADYFEEGANNLADIAWNSRSNTRDATSKAAARVRAKRTTRITQSVQSGTAGRVVRKIRNSNQCHSVTYDFFEILAHYQIELDFMPDRLRLIAMVPNPVNHGEFTPLLVRTHETALKRALIDPALAGGFSASRLVKAYEFAQELLAIQANEKKRRRDDLMSEFKRETKTTPVTNQEPAKREEIVLEILGSIQSAIHTILTTASTGAMSFIVANALLPDADRRRFKYWLFIQLCAAKFPAVLAALEALDKSTSPSMTDARLLVTALPKIGHLWTLGTLNDMTAAAKEEAALERVIRPAMGEDWRWPVVSGRCRDEGLYDCDDRSIAAHCEALRDALRDWESSLSKAGLEIEKDVLVKLAEAKQDLVSDLRDVASTAERLSIAFPFEDIAHARERQEALLKHLNEYRDHYNYALFQALPPEEQANRIVVASQNKLRMGMFEPRVVGMEGTNLAVPITSYGQAGMKTFMDVMVKALKEKLGRPDPMPEDWFDTVVVPTPGLTMSTRLGECSSCEPLIKQTHEIELLKLKALARQEAAEADRRESRLTAKDLSDPAAPHGANIRITVDRDPENPL